jgi:hypothetical protein
MTAFAAKLRLLVPDAKCVGWTWGESEEPHHDAEQPKTTEPAAD